jgi:hypothetical protein
MSAITAAEDRLWAHLPGWLWPRAPTLGLATTDGGWLRALPGAGLLLPLLGFGLGLYRGGGRPEGDLTYSYSFVWLAAMLVVSLAGIGIAVWVWSGFVLGDLLLFTHVAPYTDLSAIQYVLRVLAPLLISYTLLAVLLIATAMVAAIARGAVTGLITGTTSASLQARALTGAAAAALLAGLNAGFWTQAFPLLIRPLWTWQPFLGTPQVAGIAPVQTHPWLLGLIAAVAAAAWGWLSVVQLEQRIVGRRLQPIAAPPPARSGAPATARVVVLSVVRAAVTTLLLAGLMDSYLQGGLTLLALTTAFVVQALVLPRTAAARWWTARMPAVLRLAIAAAAAWLVAWQIGRTAYATTYGLTRFTTNTFLPLLIASVAAIAVMALLLPAAPPEPAPPEPEPR